MKKEITEAYEYLKNLHAFQGKKVLITLAIPPNTQRENVIKKIERFQAGNPTRKDRDQSKLISEMVKETVRGVKKIKESNFLEGAILFAGPIEGSGGNKEMIFELVPYVEGYEDYVNGYIGNKFCLNPLKEYINSQKERDDIIQKEKYTQELQNIKKIKINDPNLVTCGVSHVIEDIKSGRARKIIVSTQLSYRAKCPNCGVSTKINKSECEYCNNKYKNLSSLLQEIQVLCKENDVEIYIFDKSFTQILDNDYFSVVCIRRY